MTAALGHRILNSGRLSSLMVSMKGLGSPVSLIRGVRSSGLKPSIVSGCIRGKAVGWFLSRRAIVVMVSLAASC